MSSLEVLKVRFPSVPSPGPFPGFSLGAARADRFQKVAVERMLLDPRYKDILGVVKGARNGAVYGTKIRFPHALV
ncbi:hypothetical protein IMZ48_46290 [Candidatus Bathyarchaeota archaeon]|nr:hypothetical protein [Candidatus Bathyarchaeota archaeon]